MKNKLMQKATINWFIFSLTPPPNEIKFFASLDYCGFSSPRWTMFLAQLGELLDHALFIRQQSMFYNCWGCWLETYVCTPLGRITLQTKFCPELLLALAARGENKNTKSAICLPRPFSIINFEK
jgi:hypothetical protein